MPVIGLQSDMRRGEPEGQSPIINIKWDFSFYFRNFSGIHLGKEKGYKFLGLKHIILKKILLF